MFGGVRGVVPNGSELLRAPGPGGKGPSGRWGRPGGDPSGRRGPGRLLLGASELPDVPGARPHAIGVCSALTAPPSSFTAVLTPWQPRQGNM